MPDGLLGASEDFLNQTVLDRFPQSDSTWQRTQPKTLAVSLVLSHLDYSNCLLTGVPQCLLHKLKKIQNVSASLILKSSQQERTKPLLKALHWLPISDYITNCPACYNSIIASTPQYLTDLLQIYTPSHTLRSTTDTRKLKIPLFKKKYKNYILLLLL